MTTAPEAPTPAAVLAEADRVTWAQHYARVDAAVALARAGRLNRGELSTDNLEEALSAALEVLGIRPPGRIVEDIRRRFPNIYRLADGTPTREGDLIEQLTHRAMDHYATDLLDLAELIDALEADPIGTYTNRCDTDGIMVPIAVAAGDLLDTCRDQFDQLIGESYAPTHVTD